MTGGFVVSLDALVAATLLFSILLVSFFYFTHIPAQAQNTAILKKTASDLLTVLEKNGELERAVQQDSASGIENFWAPLSSAVCVKIMVFSQNDFSQPVLSATRSTCTENFSNSATLNRSFVVQNGFNARFFVARITAWQKG